MEVVALRVRQCRNGRYALATRRGIRRVGLDLIAERWLNKRSKGSATATRQVARQVDTSLGYHRGEPIVAAGGGGVIDEAIQVEHCRGGDLLRAKPRQGQAPVAGGPRRSRVTDRRTAPSHH